MGRYFGTDGIRGKANVSLDVNRAFKVGQYLGYYYAKNGIGKILIGKDTRLSSDMFEAALAAGISSSGCNAYLLGYCPTPSVAYIVKNEDYDAGAMISASHNPYYDNGIKVFAHNGVKIANDIEDLIEDYIDGKSQIELATGDKIGKVYDVKETLNDYVNWLCKEYAMDLSKYTIAIDCANGASYQTAKKCLTALKANLVVINDEPDGININNGCGSTHPEKLQALMKENHYDLGLAFDGDADRLIAVDRDGNLVNGDHILYICGNYLKAKGELVNNTVVTTVMANLGLFKAFEKCGINNVSTQVGDKYVYEKMSQENYIVGGEQSGHIIFSKHLTTGDGLQTALNLLKVMCDSQKGINELCEGLKIYPQLLVNIHVDDKNAVMADEEVLALVKEVEQELANNGRILVRTSGTEPLVRVMVEAETDEICHEKVYKVIDFIKAKYNGVL
ncbi:MAG: phosphoglucosamine mutase [Erysipelotrichaceae bacterium]|nr:phosphoglucosamine mutase [Erysipelotrichaceae bacterium]